MLLTQHGRYIKQNVEINPFYIHICVNLQDFTFIKTFTYFSLNFTCIYVCLWVNKSVIFDITLKTQIVCMFYVYFVSHDFTFYLDTFNFLLSIAKWKAGDTTSSAQNEKSIFEKRMRTFSLTFRNLVEKFLFIYTFGYVKINQLIIYKNALFFQ